MNIVKIAENIDLFFAGFKDNVRVGFHFSHILFGRYKKARELWEQIDYLDRRYNEEFVDCETRGGYKQQDFLSNNFRVWRDYDNKFLMYRFSDFRYLIDKGEKALYKELEKRRDERYELLKDTIDVSWIPKQIREKRLSQLLDK